MLRLNHVHQLSWRTVIDAVATAAMILAAIMILRPRAPNRAASPPSPFVPTQPLSLEDAETLGHEGAPIAMVVFSDFECPFCSKFSNEVLPRLKTQYIDGNRLRLVFRHYPLTGIHSRAQRAAEAAVCAGRQGKFWLFHDQLFVDPRRLDDASLSAYTHTVGLSETELDRCLNRDGPERVRRDAAIAASLQIRGTPTFYIGRSHGDRLAVSDVVAGIRPAEHFGQLFDKLLER